MHYTTMLDLKKNTRRRAFFRDTCTMYRIQQSMVLTVLCEFLETRCLFVSGFRVDQLKVTQGWLTKRDWGGEDETATAADDMRYGNDGKL